VIRCEDEGLLAQVASDRKLRKIGLRLVAPTVAVSSVGEPGTIEGLRAAGYLPMPWVEPDDAAGNGETRRSAAAGGSAGGGVGSGGSDGGGAAGGGAASTGRADRAGSGVIDLASRRVARGQASAGTVGPDNGTDKEPERVLAELSATVERGRQDRSPTLAPEPETAEAAAARLVGTLRAAGGTDADPKLVAALRRVNRVLSDDEVQILASAIVEGGAVLIRYRSASGSITDRVISDMVYSGNLLEAWCHLRDDTRNFLASEVLSVDYP
jgi:predicted DNA-binding transcriptional regulator YafY